MWMFCRCLNVRDDIQKWKIRRYSNIRVMGWVNDYLYNQLDSDRQCFWSIGKGEVSCPKCQIMKIFIIYINQRESSHTQPCCAWPAGLRQNKSYRTWFQMDCWSFLISWHILYTYHCFIYFWNRVNMFPSVGGVWYAERKREFVAS